MSSTFDQFGGDSPAAAETQSFDDGYLAPHSFPNFDSTVADSHPPIRQFTSDPAYFSNENAPILAPPAEVEYDECYAVREWRRQNAIRLEKKEKREKELLSQIIDQADEYKVEFHRKRRANCETKRVTNREMEQVFVASQEKFHAEADKDYWKCIAEIIPKEVPTVGKSEGKKDEAKKPSIVVVQGPKPGKPSNLSRMRQILLNLKHNTPPHLNHSPNAAAPAVELTWASD